MKYLFITSALVLLSGAARADDIEPIRIDYRPLGGCPSAEALYDRIFARSARVRRAGEGEIARTFVVRVSRAGAAHAAEVWSFEGDVSTEPRRIIAKTCEEAVEAATMVTALALDPHTSAATEASTEAARGGVTESPAPVSTKAEIGRHESTASRANRVATWSVGAGVRGAFLGELGVVPGGALYLERGHDHAIFDVRLRIGAGRTLGAEHGGDAGSARFTFTTGHVEACTLHRRFDDDLLVSTCLSIDAGVVDASGRAMSEAHSERRFWLVPIIGERLRWRFSSALFLDGDVSMGVPLIRDTYGVAPRTRIYRAPGVAFMAGLSLGASFR